MGNLFSTHVTRTPVHRIRQSSDQPVIKNHFKNTNSLYRNSFTTKDQKQVLKKLIDLYKYNKTRAECVKNEVITFTKEEYAHLQDAIDSDYLLRHSNISPLDLIASVFYHDLISGINERCILELGEIQECIERDSKVKTPLKEYFPETTYRISSPLELQEQKIREFSMPITMLCTLYQSFLSRRTGDQRFDEALANMACTLPVANLAAHLSECEEGIIIEVTIDEEEAQLISEQGMRRTLEEMPRMIEEMTNETEKIQMKVKILLSIDIMLNELDAFPPPDYVAVKNKLETHKALLQVYLFSMMENKDFMAICSENFLFITHLQNIRSALKNDSIHRYDANQALQQRYRLP